MDTCKFVKLGLATAALSSVMLASAITASGAADAPPPYKMPPPPPPYFLWTGFYVGAHVGAGWFDGDGDGTSGFVGGGQVGYNYQVNNWVFGLEGDFSGTTLGATYNVPTFFGPVSASWSLDWISTLTPRVGYAFDRWLVYGKAGAAWAHASASASAFGLGASVDSTTSGFVYGVGTEYALWNNWSAKLEYNGFSFSNDSSVNSGNFHTVKAGLNYRFGGF
jgi:outer membrane immunogenic protein